MIFTIPTIKMSVKIILLFDQVDGISLNPDPESMSCVSVCVVFHLVSSPAHRLVFVPQRK